MASAEAKVAVIALLILAVGFFYTNARDRMTGYAPVQKQLSLDRQSSLDSDGYPMNEPDSLNEPSANDLIRLVSPQRSSSVSQEQSNMQKVWGFYSIQQVASGNQLRMQKDFINLLKTGKVQNTQEDIPAAFTHYLESLAQGAK